MLTALLCPLTVVISLDREGRSLMNKEEILTRIGQAGIVAVVRADSVERSMAVAKACIAGGVKVIELTFTVPHADQAIANLVSDYADDPEVLIGAGTVMTAFQAESAIQAGAKFVVSPAFNAEVAVACNAAMVNYTPGCFTPTEVYQAKKYGASLVKIFPASVVGPAIIKELHGPFPEVRIMTTGGVSLDNLNDWFAAGATAVGIGGSLVGNATTELATIQKNAEQFTQKLAEWRADN